jgi:hypothetical protein
VCAKVRVACGSNKRKQVGETLAQEDGAEIHGEVDVHMAGGRVYRSVGVETARCGAGNAGRCAVYGREAALMYEVMRRTSSGRRVARNEGMVTAGKEGSAVAAKGWPVNGGVEGGAGEVEKNRRREGGDEIMMPRSQC